MRPFPNESLQFALSLAASPPTIFPLHPMRTVTILVLAAVIIFPACRAAPDPPETDADITTAAGAFDSTLAARLRSDDYGMGRFVMALLKAGPNRDQDSTRAAELQRAHMANINRLAASGDLVLAGPFLDDGELRGIYVFDVETVEEARALTETDPAIQAGRLEMELHPWYGSAAVREIGALHERIALQNP